MGEHIKYYLDVVQGTDPWLRIKHGVVSASTFKNIITPKRLELSTGAKTVIFYDEILSQRIDPTLQPHYMSYDMMRGYDDEPYAVEQYEREYGNTVKHCGFVTNSALGFPVGYSPDGLVGDDGLIEIKSKLPKLQTKVILDHIVGRLDELIPNEHMMQIQVGLWVTKRKWCDFISFCNGHPMVTIRVDPIAKYQDAIEVAAVEFEKIMQESMAKYKSAIATDSRLTITEMREIENEMVI